MDDSSVLVDRRADRELQKKEDESLFRSFSLGGLGALILVVASAVAEQSAEYPLHDAINDNNLEKMVGLLQSGHDPNEVGQHGRTALIHVIARKMDAGYLYVSELLRLGADPSAPDISGATPLHYAAIQGSASIVKLLADSGADVKAEMDQGATVLAFAYQNGHLDIASMLERYGAQIEPDFKRKLTIVGLVNKAIHKTQKMTMGMDDRDKAAFIESELRNLRDVHGLHTEMSDEYIHELVLDEFKTHSLDDEQ